ncbi:hypothetical protein [Clostridium sp. MCC353]|uniref:hypothetical protein n=1 Tax=Clostridium sp. MCC353 TaxID=2592646 RepID=UPI002079316D|nr:hypothetical protein [Clostridium sp. MCC353]
MKRNMLKTGLCLLGAVILAVTAKPFMVAKAGEGSFVTWKEGKKNEVGVALCLQKDDPLEDVVTFQIGFLLEGEELQDVTFTFDSGLRKNTEIPVKEAIYDDEDQVLTVYVSGRETVLKKTTLNLGKITVDSENDVDISVIEDSCITVDRFHAQAPVTDMGKMETYHMALAKTKPVNPPEETTAPDNEKPSKPSVPEDTEDWEDLDENDDIYSGSTDIQGSWSKEGGVWTFRKNDGSEANNEWVMIRGEWYWFDENGHMKTGWINTGGHWYYCGQSGDMKTGWINDNGTWYYTGQSGAMKTGWIQDKTYWYYLSETGAMKTGWVESNGKWYYMDPDGKMMTDAVTPDGKRVDRNGVRVP